MRTNRRRKGTKRMRRSLKDPLTSDCKTLGTAKGEREVIGSRLER